MSPPKFACSLSTQPKFAVAEKDAIAAIQAGLDGCTPDLVVAFATHHHGESLERLGPDLASATGAPIVIGCTAEGVIGHEEEVERQPGLTVWAASLPGTRLEYFEATASPGSDGPVFSGLPPIGNPKRSTVVLMADPFTFPADTYLGQLDERFGSVPVVGGMASGALGPGQTLFFTADGVRESGAVGVVLAGGVQPRPVVSQGCRPIGRPWVITQCAQNLIHKLGGQAAVEVLMKELHALGNEDRELFQSGPFIGLALDPAQSTFDRDDFLVRGIMGLHQESRSIAVADFVRRGQTVQFLVRDPASAGHDLRRLVETRGGGTVEGDGNDAAGALIFSCNGRGTRMFNRPNHDISCVQDGLHARVPVAGFFASGEFGPVGGRNFVHGFTASVAVFRSR